MIGDTSREQATCLLLRDLFTVEELRQLMGSEEPMVAVRHLLPEGTIARVDYCHVVVEALKRTGHLNIDLFTVLHRVRPGRGSDIRDVEKLFLAPPEFSRQLSDLVDKGLITDLILRAEGDMDSWNPRRHQTGVRTAVRALGLLHLLPEATYSDLRRRAAQVVDRGDRLAAAGILGGILTGASGWLVNFWASTSVKLGVAVVCGGIVIAEEVHQLGKRERATDVTPDGRTSGPQRTEGIAVDDSAPLEGAGDPPGQLQRILPFDTEGLTQNDSVHASRSAKEAGMSVESAHLDVTAAPWPGNGRSQQNASSELSPSQDGRTNQGGGNQSVFLAPIGPGSAPGPDLHSVIPDADTAARSRTDPRYGKVSEAVRKLMVSCYDQSRPKPARIEDLAEPKGELDIGIPSTDRVTSSLTRSSAASQWSWANQSEYQKSYAVRRDGGTVADIQANPADPTLVVDVYLTAYVPQTCIFNGVAVVHDAALAAYPSLSDMTSTWVVHYQAKRSYTYSVGPLNVGDGTDEASPPAN